MAAGPEMARFFFPAGFCHIFRLQMAMAGADLFAIMKAMGHTDIKATLIHISLRKSYIPEQGERQYGCDDTSLEPDSDILAIRNKLELVTPISMDLTSRVIMKSFLKSIGPGSGL